MFASKPRRSNFSAWHTSDRTARFAVPVTGGTARVRLPSSSTRRTRRRFAPVDPDAPTNIHPVDPAHHPALRLWVERLHPRAFLRRAGDNCIETVADALWQQQRRGGLAHLPLDLLARASCFVQCVASVASSLVE